MSAEADAPPLTPGRASADAAPANVARFRRPAVWATPLAVAVVAVAGVIRAWNFGSLGYQHWDDYYFITGAMAVSAAWPKGASGISWATAPLVPYTAGTLFHFLGVNTWMPIATSVVYSTLSVGGVYLIGARMLGRLNGLVAAAVMCTAEFPVMFARMAIADAAFEFWLISSVLLLWLAVTSSRLWWWALAGLATGLLLNTKYNGSFPLVLAAAFLATELVVDLVNRKHRSVSSVWSACRGNVIGFAVMGVIALMTLAPWLYVLNHNPGLPTFVARFASYSHQHTPPGYIVWYYWHFTSPATVIATGIGLAVGVVRFTRADRFLLLFTVGWFVAVMSFDAYLREALSLMPAVALWAARAVVEVWTLAARWRPRLRTVAIAGALLSVAAIVGSQSVGLSQLLSLRTEGYRDAGLVAARYQAQGETLLVRAQDSAFLYLNAQAHVFGADPSEVELLKAAPSSVVFMTDLTLDEFADAKAFFDLNQSRLVAIDRVDNPLYPELFLQPATDQRLAYVDDPPQQYRYITFWQLTAPPSFPPGWPQ